MEKEKKYEIIWSLLLIILGIILSIIGFILLPTIILIMPIGIFLVLYGAINSTIFFIKNSWIK